MRANDGSASDEGGSAKDLAKANDAAVDHYKNAWKALKA